MAESKASWLVDGPKDAPWTVILAHGAGGPMDTPAMTALAEGVAAGGHRVIRFEFPYMARRRTGKKSGGPDRPPVLEATWREVIAAAGPPERQVIGGRSMGGRIASMVAQDAGVAGLVCLGYPFHPPGRPETLRTAHLADLRVPTLILQGDRDSFGKPEEVAGYELSDSIRVVWITDGDHGLKPRKRSGLTEADNLATAVAEMNAFIAGL